MNQTKKIYTVGGAVRDMLMGIEPKDYDYVVVGSTPEEMLADGFKQVGADFPVFLDENGIEYALARKEKKVGDGYNGFVTDHSRRVTLKQDLMRRDLTINAIAMDDEHNLVDPFNGAKHIREHVLKHVSKAFAEDPVRVLRLARFRARFGAWTIHPGTVKLCKEMVAAGELNHLTRERVLKEFEKALSEPYPHLFFKTLDTVNALRVVFPQYKHYGNTSLLVQVAIGDAKSVKLRYSRLMDAFQAVRFEDAFNVQADWQRYRAMYQHANTLTDRRYPHELARLYAMDAFRQKDLVEEMYRDMVEAGDEKNLRFYDAFVKVKDIGFADLTAEQQEKLKGPSIADAIRSKRLQVLLTK